MFKKRPKGDEDRSRRMRRRQASAPTAARRTSPARCAQAGYQRSDRTDMKQLIDATKRMSRTQTQPMDATMDQSRLSKRDRLREECGVFGIFGHPDAAAITALGLHALQHRGQEAAGIVSLRRQALPLRAPHGPRRRQLLPPRGDRPPARHHRHRPRPLFHHRRDHPAQRAAAVRRARGRRLRHRPQRQPDQRPDAAPRSWSPKAR